MKKFLRIMSIILVCVLLVGCKDSNAEVKLASQKLSSSIDKIVAEVKKMESIDTSSIDISQMLGDYVYDNATYDDTYNYDQYDRNNINSANRNYGRYSNRSPYRRGTPMQIVPTQNKLVKQTNARLGAYQSGRSTRGAKRFNFVSKDTEDSYGDLYMMCNDCCNVNEEYSSCKSSLLSNCQSAKNLLENLKNSNVKVSESDIKTLNGYCEVLSKCLENLKNTSKCSSNVKNINSKKANLASNCGAINADYLQIYNTLDSNCTSCANCNRSIEDMMTFINKILNGSSQSATRNVESDTYNSTRRLSRRYNNYNGYRPRSEQNRFYQNNFNRNNNQIDYQNSYQDNYLNNNQNGYSNNYQNNYANDYSNNYSNDYQNSSQIDYQNNSQGDYKGNNQSVNENSLPNNEVTNQDFTQNVADEKDAKKVNTSSPLNNASNTKTADNTPSSTEKANESSYSNSNVKRIDENKVYHNSKTASEYLANKYFRNKQNPINHSHPSPIINARRNAQSTSNFDARLKEVRA